MRVKKVYEKKLETVTLPHNLIRFLKGVYGDILGKNEATLVESDDLLQDEWAYGGLIKEGGKEFSFTYFPTQGTKNKWEFVLNTDQLKAIYEDKLTNLDLWACTQSDCQSKFMDKNETCFYHDYFDDGQPYPNQLTKEEIEKMQEEKRELLEKLKIKLQ